MIVEALLSPIGTIITWIVQALPAMERLPDWMGYAVDIIGWGLCFFPADVWALCFGCIWFWISASLAWGVIEWVARKIPGVS